MNQEKNRLNFDNRRRYVIMLVLRGAKRLVTSVRILVFFIVTMSLIGGLFFRSCDMADPLVATINGFLLRILFLLLIPIALAAIGYVPGCYTMYRGFVRAAFINGAGEAPLLIDRHADGAVEQLEFRCKGLPLEKWNSNIGLIQAAINMTVDSIIQGKDFTRIVVQAVRAEVTFPDVIPWEDDILPMCEAEFALGRSIAGKSVTINIDRQPMLLIAGSTGSGKTSLSIVLCRQALMRGNQVFVIDFKGVDFAKLQNSGASLVKKPEDILSLLQNLATEIDQRYQLFSDLEVPNLGKYRKLGFGTDMKRIIVLVDECAMLTDYGATKEAKHFSSQVVDLLAGIARVGRAVGVHLIISTQRPDQNAVPGAIKSNLDVKICGKADKILSEIVLGDSRAYDNIPNNSQGRFIMHIGTEDIIFQSYYLC